MRDYYDKCRFPNCGRGVRSDQTTGLCREHMHAIGYCDCKVCQGRRRIPKTTVVPDHVRVVHKIAPSSTSTTERAMAVSLPREPWL